MPKRLIDMQNRFKLLVLFLAAILLPAANVTAQQSVEVTGTTMGSISFRVVVVAEDPQPAEMSTIKDAVNDSLQRVNELMSTYLEDSDISKFNRSDSTQWQAVEVETATVVARALEICELTDGAFDPTVGPAVNAWNFGPGKKIVPELPADELIEDLKSIVGYQHIEARIKPPALKKSNPKVQLDLSAIAKGYAVDLVGKSIAGLGYEDFMVVVGGEVFTQGQRVTGGPWNVAVEKPDSSGPTERTQDRAHRVVTLSGRAIATSGDYRNFFEHEGKRYSHTIDPTTCRPVNHDLTVASVIADDCMTADAMATAVIVMGQEKGAQLCAKLGYPLLTVSRDDSEGEMSHVTNVSDDFPLSQVHENGEPEPIAASRDSEQKSGSILPVFLATFLVFCLMVLGMAVGAIFNNKPVTGSCGGLANMTNEDGDSVCGICSKPTLDCPETSQG